MAKSPQLQDKNGDQVRRGRISPALASAIRLQVEQGLTLAQAAERVGYQRDSLAKALCKGHVKAFRARVKAAWLEAETSRSWAVVGDLRDTAQSEKVKLEASRTFLQASGDLAPPLREGEGPTVQLIQFIRQDPADRTPLRSVNGVNTIDAEYAVVGRDARSSSETGS